MQNLERLWRAVEAIPGLAAVRAEWSEWLGPELAWVEPRLLRPTGDIATVFPCEGGTPYHVVDHGNDRYRAVHPDGRTTLDLSRDDLIVRRLDVQSLATMLAPALGFDAEPFVGRAASGVLRIGKWRATAKTTCPVSLCIRPDPTLLQDAVRRAIADHGGPQIVIIPGVLGDDDLVRLAQSRSACLLSLSEVITPGADGAFVATPIAERVLDGFRRSVRAAESMAAGDEPNVFRRVGDVWELRFEGGTSVRIPQGAAKGLAYIHLVLQQPGTPHDVADLEQAVAGVADAAQPGSAGEVLDETARREFRRQYAELEDAIDIAETTGDADRADTLRATQSALADQLRAGFGLGGRPRTAADDTSRMRIRVKMAIDRAIDAIQKQDPVLAQHLRANVNTGYQVTYVASPLPNWAF